MRTIIRLTATGLLVLALAACGGSPSGTPAGQDDAEAATVAQATMDPNEPEDAGAVIYEEEVPVPGTDLDACGIVTPEDVAAAFGVDAPVEPGVAKATPTVLSPGRTECTYQGDFGRLIVGLTPEDGANLYDAAYGSYDDVVVLEGLGDGAFWSATERRAFVWQERVTAMLTIGVASDAVEPIDVAAALGESIIAKL